MHRGGRAQVPIDTGMSFMVHDFVLTTGTWCSSCARSCSTFGRATGQVPPRMAAGTRHAHRGAAPRRHGRRQWIQDGPFFVYHFMNAHEDGGRITVDYVQHGSVLHGAGCAVHLVARRARLGAGTIKRQPLDDRNGEFPRIDSARVGAVNRYGWLPVSAKATPPKPSARSPAMTSGPARRWCMSSARAGRSTSRFSCRVRGHGRE